MRALRTMIGTVTATVGAATAAGVVRAARGWMARWGSTKAEQAAHLPGDGLVPAPLSRVTRSITVDAPCNAVWPWIAQMGSAEAGRAGWYSYDRLDNGGRPSADHLRRDVPAPYVGDVLVPESAFAWTVREVEPGSHLVLELTSPPGWFQVHTFWTILLRHVDDATCRLVERSAWDMRPRVVGHPFSLVFEVVDFVMMRRHLLNLRDRAEGRDARGAGQPTCVRLLHRPTTSTTTGTPSTRAGT